MGEHAQASDAAGNVVTQVAYNLRGMRTQRTIKADATYKYEYAYNNLGELHTLTWPVSTSGVRVKAKYLYTNGRLTQIRQFTGDVDGPNLWSLNLLDARGSAVSEAYGNGLWLQSAFDPLTGSLTQRRSGTGGAESNVQQLAYGWDEAGNLASRQDLNQGLTETFGYDALDRLTSASGPGGTLTVAYDAIGNITSRSDVGSYGYHATKKHAVVTAGSNSYSYDANGNLSTRNGYMVRWTSYNLPALINVKNYSAAFSYTPERSRWRQTSPYAAGKEITIYVGGQLEKLSTPVRTSWKHRIATPSGEVQVIRRSDGTSETLYLASDHLGSVDAVLDGAGAVLARPSFTAWGGRRSSSWQGAPSQSEWQAIANHTRRGYTGHEQLDNVLLVHMNGRVYDPAVGRFLSADPYVDCAQDMAGWNRYSYVKNRPLSFTDPSGYSSAAIRGFSLGGQVKRIEFGPKGGGGAAAGAGGGGGSQGLEEIVTTASRLVRDLSSVFAQLDVDAMLRGLAQPTASTGGGSGSAGAPTSEEQRDEKFKECLETCQAIANSVTQTVAGIAGGATTGLIASGSLGGMAAGAAVGGATAFGISLLPQQLAARAYGGVLAGTAGGYFEARHRGGSTGPGAIGGAIGEAVGGAIGGSDGSVIGGSVGGAVGAGLAARASGVAGVLALGSAFRGAAAGALGGVAYNGALSLLNPVAESACETFCQ